MRIHNPYVAQLCFVGLGSVAHGTSRRDDGPFCGTKGAVTQVAIGVVSCKRCMRIMDIEALEAAQ